MTDPTGPDVPEVAPEDELASALADGEAAPAEAARADEPGVAHALAAHREVARLVATPVDPPSDDDRERAIAAALAAFDLGETDQPAAPAGDDLAARRARRRVPQWVAAVAAALLVLGGLGLLASLGESGDDDHVTETASNEADTDSTTAAADAAGAGAGGAAATTTAGAFEEAAGSVVSGAPAPAIPYLGDFAAREDLLTVARNGFAAREAAGDSSLAVEAADPAAPLAVPCGDAVGRAAGSTVLGTATLDGALVTVVVETADDGTRTLVVFAEPSCVPDRSDLDQP